MGMLIERRASKNQSTDKISLPVLTKSGDNSAVKYMLLVICC